MTTRTKRILQALAIIKLHLAYFLSIGPVGWFLTKLDLSLGWFLAIMGILYFPLTWLADKSAWFGRVFRWYINLWF